MYKKPKGPGVYIFPSLGTEQHGRYTVVKLQPESVAKYKNLGYQTVPMRSAPPAMDPMEVEANTRTTIQVNMITQEMLQNLI